MDIITEFVHQFEKYIGGKENTAPQAYIDFICGSLESDLSWFKNQKLLKLSLNAADKGLLHKLEASQLSLLKKKTGACLQRHPTYSHNIVFALGLSGFSDRRWCLFLIKKMLVPYIRAATSQNNYPAAIAIENLLYNQVINKNEASGLFGEIYPVLVPLLEECGRTAQHEIKLPPPSVHNKKKKTEIIWVVSEESMLAHTTVMSEMLRVLQSGGQTQYEFKVISLIGKHEGFRIKLRSLGVELISLEGTTIMGIFELRKYCSTSCTDVIIWVSYPVGMVFAYAMRIAPVQIWLSMKHHDLKSKHIDAYLTGGSLEEYKTINGRPWRNLRASMSNLLDMSKKEEAHRIRRDEFSKFKKIILTIGRAAKLNSPPFLKSVTAVLKNNKDTAFLWASRHQDPDIQRVFDENDVADQCFFLGWVDPLLYVHLADVYLDCFPFPSGLVAMQAMAASKPIVFYSSEDSLRTGVPGIVMSGLKSKDVILRNQLETIFCPTEPRQADLFPAAKTPLEYEAFADELLRDEQKCQDVGAANANFARQFLSNDDAFSKSFMQHISELISEKA